MKLLLFTQIVDRKDPALGFAHGWIEEFARQCEHVHVICLKEGEHALPSNVHVWSLGKETAPSRLKYIIRFYRYIWRLRHEYDAVFVHMNPEYVVLGGLLWRMWGKRIGLWYTHRNVYWALRCATRLMHHGFTGSKESFRIESPKILVTGQGVDTELFTQKSVDLSSPLSLLVVGRVAPIKNIELALSTLAEVRKTQSARLVVVGAPVTDNDRVYEATLHAQADTLGIASFVEWVGGKDAKGVREALQHADVFLHTSNSNSADKTMVEAMASGLYVISSSRVYAKDVPESCIQESDPQKYAEEIIRFAALSKSEREILAHTLRESAVRSHSLRRLIGIIVERLQVGR